jgi:hypothetical protein
MCSLPYTYCTRVPAQHYYFWLLKYGSTKVLPYHNVTVTNARNALLSYEGTTFEGTFVRKYLRTFVLVAKVYLRK